MFLYVHELAILVYRTNQMHNSTYCELYYTAHTYASFVLYSSRESTIKYRYCSAFSNFLHFFCIVFLLHSYCIKMHTVEILE
jgi:hypothetical protein